VHSNRPSNGEGREGYTATRSSMTRRALDEQAFQARISLERKRTERSRKPFLLILVHLDDCVLPKERTLILQTTLELLGASLRETDVIGWYLRDSVVGAMFTDIMADDHKSVANTLLAKISNLLRSSHNPEEFSKLRFSCYVFPEDWDQQRPSEQHAGALYPDLRRRDEVSKVLRVVKRLMDVGGSLFTLALLSPLLMLIAAAIKISSPGPVLFRQQRIGQQGVPFTFLKFRSMYIDNDTSIHREYVRRLIAGCAERKPSRQRGDGVYKLTDDPRVTRIGAFLRRTSLDELPQLLNVLRGEMSLVGPRPAIPYEVASYEVWHRRRVLEAKPGITGLWQVNGRSRVEFDDMVRLDLRYARTWSPWLDIKILLQTPRAVLEGDGAY
jgi:lipopolysaccharide/colanic/teichoic acid biosynthesis glycosyltransferase